MAEGRSYITGTMSGKSTMWVVQPNIRWSSGGTLQQLWRGFITLAGDPRPTDEVWEWRDVPTEQEP